MLLLLVKHEDIPVQTLIPHTNTNALPLPRLPTPRTRRRRHLPPTRLLRRLQLLLRNHSHSLFLSIRLLRRCSRRILLIDLPNQRNLGRKPLLERLGDEEAISVEPARKRRRELPCSFSTIKIGGCDSDVINRRMFRYRGGYRELIARISVVSIHTFQAENVSSHHIPSRRRVVYFSPKNSTLLYPPYPYRQDTIQGKIHQHRPKRPVFGRIPA